MQTSDHQEQNVTSPTGLTQHSVRRTNSRRLQTAARHDSSLSERSKSTSFKQKDAVGIFKDSETVKVREHKIDIGDEKSDLLGYEVYSGKLVLENKNKSSSVEKAGSGSENIDCFDARLSSKALTWGSHVLKLEDIISVSHNAGLRHFTVHAYPIAKRSGGLSCFVKPRRTEKNFRFLASSPEEAFRWISGFADQQCFTNLLPHPIVANKKHSSELLILDPMFEQPYIKSRNPPKILVILNPRSGHGRSSKVFHSKVEPIFKLAGFKMEIIKTTHAGHAKKLASSVDFSSCPDGIVCVGGDGIVNEVLNGLLCRGDQKEAISIPIGIIPAGSDNSLVWTVLGVRDPISAALSIVKGGLTPTDVFAVEWLHSGVIHFGTTVSYFGFLSDVLEVSEKYQKRFGPLRYFVAGFLKFLCLPKYSFEIEYLPMTKESAGHEHFASEEQDKIDLSDLYTDIMQRSMKEGLPRASSLSSIDSVLSPGGMSGGDLDTTGSSHASNEPSELVRALDPESKRLSLGRNNAVTEPEEVVHPQPHGSSNPNWRRSKSKTRTDKAWTGSTTTNDLKSSRTTTSVHDREDSSSTVSDPGPVWDSGPKWDAEPKWDNEPSWEPENAIGQPGPANDIEVGVTKELVPKSDDKWVVRKGRYLGVLICNHSCKTVQSLSSLVVAPKAEYDDNSLDLLLVAGSGRMRLLRFFVLLQFGRHLSLPYVEYVKVKSVKLRPGTNTQNGCGIDGELLRVKGQVKCCLLPQQCRLIGRPAKDHIQ